MPRRDREPAWVVPALAGVFALSGAAGLIHEVVWARLLARVFGASSLAVATVLAAYMAGLALGSWWIGSRLRGIADRRRAYALLEIGIGVAALLVPVLLRLVEPLYGVLWRRFGFSFAVFTVVRFAIAFGLLVGPTVLMGATLPLLADYFAERRDGARGLTPAWLYTVNLSGAAVGVAAAGFVIMPAWGLRGTILAGAAVNIIAGLVVLGLPRLADDRSAPAPDTLARSSIPLALVIAAVASGLGSLATQVVWTRVLILVVGSSTYAFSAVLLVYLVALMVGSAWASRRGARRDPLTDLAVVHALLGVFTFGAVYAVDRLPGWYAIMLAGWGPSGMAGTLALDVLVSFGLLALPVLSAGAVLPLALSGAVSAARCEVGAVVGTVYALNTVGAISGALLAGFVLLPTIGSQATLLGASVVAGLLAVLFAEISPRRRTLAAPMVAVTVTLIAGSLLEPPWTQEALNAAAYDPVRPNPRVLVHPLDRVVFHREGRTASVAVIERKTIHSLRINGRVNASDNPLDVQTQVMLAEVPLLLAPRSDDVFLLGWGSGVTAGAALRGPVSRLTAVEIEPAVVAASDLFRHVNHDARDDPRLRLYEDDARHILRASEDTYDAIISEPSHPWVTGVADLFTRDFFALAARRLRPDGVFIQWLQGYQISLQTFHSILFTFASVFPHVLVYAPPHNADWILIGGLRPLRLDLAALDRRWMEDGIRTETARVGLGRAEDFLAGIYLGPDRVAEITREGQMNTDDNMFVEFHAPADIHLAYGARLIAAAVAQVAAPVETMLADPNVLLQDPNRLRALIDALGRQGRDPDHYRALLASLP